MIYGLSLMFAHSIGKALNKDKKYHTVIVKSTVLPGTTSTVVQPILEKESGKKATEDFGIGSNPEFLKEGSAVNDFFHTDRIVIGYKRSKNKKDTGDSIQTITCSYFYYGYQNSRNDQICEQCISRNKN